MLEVHLAIETVPTAPRTDRQTATSATARGKPSRMAFAPAPGTASAPAAVRRCRLADCGTISDGHTSSNRSSRVRRVRGGFAVDGNARFCHFRTARGLITAAASVFPAIRVSRNRRTLRVRGPPILHEQTRVVTRFAGASRGGPINSSTIARPTVVAHPERPRLRHRQHAALRPRLAVAPPAAARQHSRSRPRQPVTRRRAGSDLPTSRRHRLRRTWRWRFVRVRLHARIWGPGG